MPKTRLQDAVYTVIMAAVMVYAMVCFNIALNIGKLNNGVFLEAFKEFPFMWVVAGLLEFFVIGKIAHKLAFKAIDPKKQPPIIVAYAISIVIVCFMCPIMSLIATLFISRPDLDQIFVVWLKCCVLNFPMAMCFQLFYAGPFVRFIFSFIFREKAK